MIQLPKQVLNSDVLKRLMYYNAFTVGEMVRDDLSDAALQVAMISMIGMGGFAYDENKDESGGQS